MRLFKYLIIVIIWISISTNIFAQDYNVKNIPDELKYNSKAVVQKENIVFEVEGTKRATQHVIYAITILNENGIKNAEFVKFYNSFSKIRNIKAVIYDKNGEKVKKIPYDKIYDFSAISGFSLYEDSRVKFIDPNYRTYPFTIEYSYTIDYNGILNYPLWQPYKDFNIAIMSSEFQLIIDKDINPRFLSRNLNIKPIEKIKNSKKIYTWSLEKLKSLEKESFSTPFSEFTPTLFLAPTNFSVDGFDGNMETWENFGKWITDLNKGKSELPEETHIIIKDLVKNCKNRYDSVATIYKYMQNKSRYVSIQDGIGSWQPFDAETVDRLCYGDCKALANYVKSLLDIVNIKSNYILIRAGEDTPNILLDFPSNQFNHAIVCVPGQKDTIWLECTNLFSPAGYLGTFTDDRDALLIDDSNSRIIHTPIYSEQTNQMLRKTELTLDNEGNGVVNINTRFSGLYYDHMFPITVRDDKDKKKIIYKSISFANFDIENFSYNIENSRLPILYESLSLKVRECATNMGDLLLIDLTTINRIKELPSRLENRKSNIYVKRVSSEIDSVSIIYPKNYSTEAIPQNISISSEFGEYSLELFPDTNKLLCVRTLKINKGNHKPEKYNDFIKFYKRLYKADNAKLVLKKL